MNNIDEAIIILNKTKENPILWEKLKDKCMWEHMTLLAVILNWGDPKDWE